MFGTTGKYSVQFQHGQGQPFERHEMLNSDDLTEALAGFGESIKVAEKIKSSDITAIRLFNNEMNWEMGQWRPRMRKSAQNEEAA